MVPLGAFVWSQCNTAVNSPTATGALPRTRYPGQCNILQYPRGCSKLASCWTEI